MNVYRFLVTGDNAQLQKFHLITCLLLDDVEQCGQACLYTCPKRERETTLEVAKLTNVTIQVWNDNEWEIITGPGPGWQPKPQINTE